MVVRRWVHRVFGILAHRWLPLAIDDLGIVLECAWCHCLNRAPAGRLRLEGTFQAKWDPKGYKGVFGTVGDVDAPPPR